MGWCLARTSGIQRGNAVSQISVRNVSKYWGDTRAVDKVNFEAAAASLLVLLGPSGCGKSTTLRLIAGLEQVSSGRIFIGADDVTELAPAKRRIAMVFQSYALFPHLTVAENIVFGLKVRKTPAAERSRRLARVAALLGLDALLARKPSQLSGGQQQRVGVARALAADPPVLLMDEPFSAVDPLVRASLQDQLITLQTELHRTIVLVTHDIEEAIKVGDLVALYKPEGRLAQFGTPERLLGAPADDYVAGFVGFDRGIRRLSFFPAAGLDLSAGPLLGADAIVAKAQATGEPWILVVNGGKPRGWVPQARLAALPGDMPLEQVPADGFGHTFLAGSGSLRAALDAAVISPAGQAIGVDEDGRVVGVATFDELRAAIQAADQAADCAADQAADRAADQAATQKADQKADQAPDKAAGEPAEKPGAWP